MENENKKQALPEKQALTNEAVNAISDADNIAAGGVGLGNLKNLDWKKGAKIAAATAIGATAIGGAAIGGKKLYDKKVEDSKAKETAELFKELPLGTGFEKD